MNNLITSTQQNGVLTIKINRFDKKNALTNAMYLQLCQLFTQASDDKTVRCVLIQGDENCFCAGNDLEDFLNSDENSDLAAFKFIKILAAFNKPLVAAVAGAAIGIGTTLLLHCDMVYAAINSKFKLPFTQLGLCPEAGSSLLLPLRLGTNRAFELMVLGESFSAEQAYNYGLVNKICQVDELLTIADKTAQAIATLPVESVMASRKLIREASQTILSQVIENEAKEFFRLVNGKECKDIIAKFFS